MHGRRPVLHRMQARMHACGQNASSAHASTGRGLGRLGYGSTRTWLALRASHFYYPQTGSKRILLTTRGNIPPGNKHWSTHIPHIWNNHTQGQGRVQNDPPTTKNKPHTGYARLAMQKAHKRPALKPKIKEEEMHAHSRQRVDRSLCRFRYNFSAHSISSKQHDLRPIICFRLRGCGRDLEDLGNCAAMQGP